ncbi:hypothetical protein [Ferrovum sp.]|uniref:hypothetical protein n=1 Tax=Ferrovum sp. TaxID=2609467 RepID=UPI002606C547|nr:hypothetical protein [Ferrovum sp.]
MTPRTLEYENHSKVLSLPKDVTIFFTGRKDAYGIIPLHQSGRTQHFMLETIVGLLFLGSIVFVATTGESSTDKKEDEKEDKKYENKENPDETVKYDYHPEKGQGTTEPTPPP